MRWKCTAVLLQPNVLDYAGSRSFDSRTTPNSWENFGSPGTPIPDSTQFDLVSSFGSTPNCNLHSPYLDVVICDDLGDLHMDSGEWQPYTYVVEVVDGDTLSIPFEVNTQVSYVNIAYPDSTLPSSVRTKTKKVTVQVRSVQHQHENSARGKVTIERMFTYDADAAIRSTLCKCGCLWCWRKRSQSKPGCSFPFTNSWVGRQVLAKPTNIHRITHHPSFFISI